MNCIVCGKQTFMSVEQGSMHAAFCDIHIPEEPERGLEAIIKNIN